MGPVISWFHQLFSADRGFRVSIEFLSDRAIVAGIAPGEDKPPVHLEVESATNHEVIDAFAYSIMQQQMGNRVPEVSALSVKEFKALLTTLNAAAKMNAQLSLGAQVSKPYVDLLDQLAPLVQKMPRWVALLRIAGQMAENSENDQLALQYYQRELAVLSDKDLKYTETKTRVSEVQSRLVAKSKASISAQIPRNLSSKIIEQDPLLRQLLASKVTESILRSVGVESLDMPKEVLIAVAGGFPRLNDLPEKSYTILGSDSAKAKSDPMMEDYVDSLVQWVRVIAPKARFVFAPLRSESDFSGAFSDSELLRALDQLVDAQPQVILWTFGPMRGEIWSRAMSKTAERGILLVQAAGNSPNEPISFEGTNLLDRMVVAGAVDQYGRRAEFSPNSKQVVWAPGVQLPVQVPGATEFSLRSGTSYSAAISAGVAARIYSERHFNSPDQIVKLLRETASPARGQAEPRIINLANALKRLHQ
ncbi:S8 family peptidase [Nitrospira sp. Nam80]